MHVSLLMLKSLVVHVINQMDAIQPTVIETDPKFVTMCEEIFGRYLRFTYVEGKFEETLSWLTILHLMPYRCYYFSTEMQSNWLPVSWLMLPVILYQR